MAERREGRGRLSSIDLLPEDAEEDIAWALEQLRARDMPQIAIVAEFNRRLAARGIDPVTKSSFSRWSVRKAVQFRNLNEVRSIAGEITGALGTDGSDDVTVVVAEMLKAAVYAQLEQQPTTKGLMELSRTLQAAVGAQRTSEEYRRRLEQRHADKIAQAADRATDIAREGGLSAESIAKMRHEFLGVSGAS
ncbi:phage protein Gp27 family protein [Sphingomonas silueang]|uniref:phage protein Gp27 family protein n=1 Tax=Sphingomonas silueang TaxID=3156617 RepID=UPI0032B60C3F